MRIRYASLCTGIAGFDAGFDAAGMECVFQCEQDRDCLKVLARHYPGVERTTDVNDDATADAIRRLRPDVIAFGSPCQDLSVAGNRKGLAGQRSGLFFRCVELCFIGETPLVVWENVPGVFSSAGGEDFATVLEAFTGFRPTVPTQGWRDTGVCIGPLYSVAWCVLDAQWFGVAQRRNRVFLVASLGSRSRPYEILSLAESVPWDIAPSRETGTGVADCFTAGGHNGQDDDKEGRLILFDTTQVTSPGNYSDPKPGAPCHPLAAGAHAPAIAGFISARACRNSDSAHEVGIKDGDISDTLQSDGPGAVAFQADDYHEGTFEQSDLSRPLTTSADRSRAAPIVAFQCHGSNVGPMGTLRSGNGNETGGVPFTFAIQERACSESETSGPGGKGYQADVAFTMESRHHQQSVANRMGVRRLLPIECERLQGFADDWTRYDAEGKELSDSARYRACGNAVCVSVSRWLGERIVAVC